MVLAFTRLNNTEDIILRCEGKNVHYIEWRENFVPKESFYYESEDEAYDNFEKASDLLEGVMEIERQAKEAKDGKN